MLLEEVNGVKICSGSLPRLNESDSNVFFPFGKFDEFLFSVTVKFESLESLDLGSQMLDDPLWLFSYSILQMK